MVGSEGGPSIRGILIDLDGVIYQGGAAIPGAAAAIGWLQERKIPFLFLTNTTQAPRSAIVENLGRFGIKVRQDEIFTPPAAAASWLRTRVGDSGVALFVRPIVRHEFGGLRLLADGAETGAACVVVGDLGKGWSFETLNRAFRLLYSAPESMLVALGMTRYYQGSDGVVLDVAPIVAALENATGKSAIVLGKPAAGFFHSAAELLRLAPSELLMIGDDIRTDVGGAHASGLLGAIVKTGKFRESDLAGDVVPDFVMKSIADIGQILK